jgi:predicted DNA binding CopG/RHH family protein
MMACLNKSKDGTKLGAKFSKDLFAEGKQKLSYLKEKIGVKFRFSEELLMKAAAHAEERGMTLDEYIKEAAELAQKHNYEQNETNPKENLD